MNTQTGGFQYKLMKVYDSADLPGSLREDLFNWFDDRINNGIYVGLYLEDKAELQDVIDWFIENGAEPGEQVLIKIDW